MCPRVGRASQHLVELHVMLMLVYCVNNALDSSSLKSEDFMVHLSG